MYVHRRGHFTARLLDNSNSSTGLNILFQMYKLFFQRCLLIAMNNKALDNVNAASSPILLAPKNTEGPFVCANPSPLPHLTPPTYLNHSLTPPPVSMLKGPQDLHVQVHSDMVPNLEIPLPHLLIFS